MVSIVHRINLSTIIPQNLNRDQDDVKNIHLLYGKRMVVDRYNFKKNVDQCKLHVIHTKTIILGQ